VEKDAILSKNRTWIEVDVDDNVELDNNTLSIPTWSLSALQESMGRFFNMQQKNIMFQENSSNWFVCILVLGVSFHLVWVYRIEYFLVISFIICSFGAGVLIRSVYMLAQSKIKVIAQNLRDYKLEWIRLLLHNTFSSSQSSLAPSSYSKKKPARPTFAPARNIQGSTATSLNIQNDDWSAGEPNYIVLPWFLSSQEFTQRFDEESPPQPPQSSSASSTTPTVSPTLTASFSENSNSSNNLGDDRINVVDNANNINSNQVNFASHDDENFLELDFFTVLPYLCDKRISTIWDDDNLNSSQARRNFASMHARQCEQRHQSRIWYNKEYMHTAFSACIQFAVMFLSLCWTIPILLFVHYAAVRHAIQGISVVRRIILSNGVSGCIFLNYRPTW
jgi:hypothetical protein